MLQRLGEEEEHSKSDQRNRRQRELPGEEARPDRPAWAGLGMGPEDVLEALQKLRGGRFLATSQQPFHIVAKVGVRHGSSSGLDRRSMASWSIILARPS